MPTIVENIYSFVSANQAEDKVVFKYTADQGQDYLLQISWATWLEWERTFEVIVRVSR